MKTLNAVISDIEYSKSGFTGNILSFSKLNDSINRKLMKKNLTAATSQAEACGLSSMSMEEITTEVQAVRCAAKSNN
jgi:hypothetical protein